MEYTFVIVAIPPTPEEFELLWESSKKNFLAHDTYRIPTTAGLDNEFQINQTDADKKDWIFTSLRSLDMFHKVYKDSEIAGVICLTYRPGLENVECLNELIPDYGQTSVVAEFGLYRDMGKGQLEIANEQMFRHDAMAATGEYISDRWGAKRSYILGKGKVQKWVMANLTSLWYYCENLEDNDTPLYGILDSSEWSSVEYSFADGWGWPENPPSINPLWKKGVGLYPQPLSLEEE